MWPTLLILACTPEPPASSPGPIAEPPSASALVFDGPAPRNLWVISVDTWRRDHFDPLASDGVTRSPFLAARAAEGVLLEAHRQCADWTLHAMTCTTLGRQVEELGWVPRPDGTGTPAPDGLGTLAVRLAEVGYQPLVSSANGYFGPEWNSVQGYRVLPGLDDALSIGRTGLAELQEQRLAQPGAPWFLHLHVTEPHGPYDPPEDYLEEVDQLEPIPFDLSTLEGQGRLQTAYRNMDPDGQALALAHLTGRYTAEVRWLDDQLAVVWDEMDGAGLLDDTLVVVFNDHGEAFLDHDQWRHGHTLFREEADGILFFWARGLRPGRVVEPTASIDLVPTVLDVLGVPGDDELPGHVVGLAPADRPIFSSTAAFDGPMAGVRVGDDELFFTFDGGLQRFDLAADPRELRDLATPGDPTTAALWKLLAPRVELLDAAVVEMAAPPGP